MKNRNDEMKNEDQTSGSPKYWLSLEQWKDDPEFKEVAQREFLSSPFIDGDAEGSQGGWARREFLKLMGASMALSSFGCVRRPAQKIIPYAKRPAEVVMGQANYYASSFLDGVSGFGTLVATREGRPIKIDGNKEHPYNKGGLSARAHAHVLELYDPDRLSGARQNLLNDERTNRDTISISWKNLDKEVAKAINKGRVAVLTGAVASPSLKALLSDFRSATGAKHYVWTALNMGELAKGQKKSYGSAVVPQYRFDKANYILSIGADFLGTYGNPTANTAAFSQRRKPFDGDMNRLVVFESAMSLTGANADNRYRVKPSQLKNVLMAVIKELLSISSISLPSDFRQALKDLSAESVGVSADVIQGIAKELKSHRGKSLVLTGGISTQTVDSVELQVLTNFLNSILGNDGKTVDYKLNSGVESGSDAELSRLMMAMKKGEIKTLIINGTNPVYSVPEFKQALDKVETVVYAGDRNDETGSVSHFLATTHHGMENWGDAEFTDGAFSIQQPTIRPLNDTRSFEDSLLSWAKAAKKARGRLSASSWYEFVKSYWKSSIYGQNRKGIAAGSFDDFWVSLLQSGVFVTRKPSSANSRSFRGSSLSGIKPNSSLDLELVLYPTVGLMDGSMANVSWLQEFPDPVTKICWDNYASFSPATASEMGLKEESVVNVTANGRTLKLPVHVQPGQADGVVAIAVGYGRTAAGKVANGVGQNAFTLATWAGDHQVFSGALTSVAKVKGGCYRLANVQGHHSMEGRQIIVEATLDQFKKNKAANLDKKHVFSIWGEHEYTGHKWGMSVDLSSCTGCGSCMIACQSENNIPTVGKKYILEGREMHWIRVDRYYTGSPDDPDALFMPVMCQHCDNAPCETVCPVAATVHSEEGTNDMIYNRCVGTRYCANNCPYKVRRFNWFNYVKTHESPLHLALNPEVSVRDRGVMEKCTFCSHKIKEAKSTARVEKRAVRDGDIEVACQSSCPANCITFGDMNDPDSAVSKEFAKQNAYGLLEELNNKPAVRYLTKIRHSDKVKTKPTGHGSHGEHGQGHSKEGHH
jgi:MoCo/4Fe-4S cofactor protein with predicted Tat translocation signal